MRVNPFLNAERLFNRLATPARILSGGEVLRGVHGPRIARVVSSADGTALLLLADRQLIIKADWLRAGDSVVVRPSPHSGQAPKEVEIVRQEPVGSPGNRDTVRLEASPLQKLPPPVVRIVQEASSLSWDQLMEVVRESAASPGSGPISTKLRPLLPDRTAAIQVHHQAGPTRALPERPLLVYEEPAEPADSPADSQTQASLARREPEARIVSRLGPVLIVRTDRAIGVARLPDGELSPSVAREPTVPGSVRRAGVPELRTPTTLPAVESRALAKETLPAEGGSSLRGAERTVLVTQREGGSLLASRNGLRLVQPALPGPPESEWLLDQVRSATPTEPPPMRARMMLRPEGLRAWAATAGDTPIAGRAVGWEEGHLFLETDRGVVRARSDHPVPEGRTLQLRIVPRGPQVELLPVSTPSQQNEVVQRLAGAVPAEWSSARTFGRQLLRMLVSAGPAARQAVPVLESLREASPEILLSEGSKGAERLLRESGLWYENRLARAATPEAMQQISSEDIKGLLLRLLETEPLRDPNRALGELRKLAEGHLESIEGQQARGLAASWRNSGWVLDLPWNGDLPARLFVGEEEEGHRRTGKGPGSRRVLFLLDLEGAGNLRIDALVSQETVSATVYATDPGFRDYFSSRTEQLEEALLKAGYPASRVRVLSPSEQPADSRADFDRLTLGLPPGDGRELDMKA